MNIYRYKYIKNPEYEVSDMKEYLSIFIGNMNQVFFLRDSEIKIFNLFDKAISINSAIKMMVTSYAKSEADKVTIKKDCEDFLIKLIENRILIKSVS